MNIDGTMVLLRYRRFFIVATFVAIIVAAQLSAFLLRFDFRVGELDWHFVTTSIAFAIPLKLMIFYSDRLHRGWLVYAGMSDLFHALAANLLASLVYGSVILLVFFDMGYPRSVLVIDGLLCFLGVGGARLSARLLREHSAEHRMTQARRRALIYGAGWAGASILRELRTRADARLNVVGFIDDSPAKQAEWVLGVPVLGRGEDLERIVQSHSAKGQPIDQILIAVPSAKPEEVHRVVSLCRATAIPSKKLPALADMLERKLTTQLQDLTVEDLLHREPILLEVDRVQRTFEGRSILVTGGAGSIGSELCQQLARFGPRRLVVLDQAESDMFRVEQSIRSNFPRLDFAAEIGDIQDSGRVEEVLGRHDVDFVFHSAAYKHVPLMESHVVEAVKNNVLAAWDLAGAAIRHGVRRFVLISSDKAVNPTNVMGATKRAAELLLSSLSRPSAAQMTQFVAVRFGNVLASNGSVVPLFQQQIAAGGPVTVTDPEVRRFFMTAPEAAQLVLQAAAMGQGAEIFVLDMGKLIRIQDLARDMIRLSGFVPGEDIELRYTGLRPGEKLYEELIAQGERIRSTAHPKVKVFQGEQIPLEVAEDWVAGLRRIVERRDADDVVTHLKLLVPEYQISPYLNAVNGDREKSVQ